MQGKFRHAAHLSAVIHPARILAESGFLSIAQEIRAADMVVMAHFRAAQAREIAFGLISAGFAAAIRLLVIDAAHFVL